MRRLDGLDRRIDRLGARVPVSRAKRHDDDGILVGKALELLVLVLQHADLRSRLERLCRMAHLWIELISRLCRLAEYSGRRADEPRCQHLFPMFHDDSSLITKPI